MYKRIVSEKKGYVPTNVKFKPTPLVFTHRLLTLLISDLCLYQVMYTLCNIQQSQ